MEKALLVAINLYVKLCKLLSLHLVTRKKYSPRLKMVSNGRISNNIQCQFEPISINIECLTDLLGLLDEYAF